MGRAIADCKFAVLFGMPTSQATYRDMASGRWLNDYREVTFRGQSPDDVWLLRYARIVAAAEALIDEATRLDGRVYREATLLDLEEASESATTLIVLAHWKGYVVTASDFKVSASEFIERVRSSENITVAALRRMLGNHNRSMDANSLASMLTLVIKSGELLKVLPEEMEKQTSASTLLREALSRDLVDEALGDVLARGNRIELFDGLHSPLAFSSAINEEFSGEIDLGSCTSQALATYLLLLRPRGIHVVFTRELLDPLPTYITIRHTLADWCRSEKKYGTIRIEAEQALRSLSSASS